MYYSGKSYIIQETTITRTTFVLARYTNKVEPPTYISQVTPIPKMSGLVKKVGPFSKRTNPL